MLKSASHFLLKFFFQKSIESKIRVLKVLKSGFRNCYRIAIFGWVSGGDILFIVCGYLGVEL